MKENMKMQYRHFKDAGRSFAVETPAPCDLQNAMFTDLSDTLGQYKIELYVGMSRLHPLDRFSRKKGREIAVNNMKNQEFFLQFFSVDHHEIHQVWENADYALGFTISRKTGVIRLDFVETQ